MWMAVEGFNLYLSFVKIAETDIDHFILKSSVFAWGEFVLGMILCTLYVSAVYSCALRRVQNQQRAKNLQRAQNLPSTSSEDSLFCSADSVESGKCAHCLKNFTGKSM